MKYPETPNVQYVKHVHNTIEQVSASYSSPIGHAVYPFRSVHALRRNMTEVLIR